MRKALIASDLHIRPKPEELAAAKRLLAKILKEVIARRPQYLFLLGDIFHTKDRIYQTCLSVFNDFLEEVTQYTEVIILVGNHDWAVPYSVHSLESFKRIPNVTIVDDIFRLDEKNGFISYCRERDRFDSMLAKLGPCERLFGHLDINSFKVGSGWEEVHAFCDPEYFQNFRQVFSGHLHLAQEKTLSNGTEIIYIGTGYTTDFGESDQIKRMIELDLDSGEYESISTELTLHKTIRIHALDPFPVIPLEEVSNGVEYRLVISGTKEQISSLIKPKDFPATIVYEFSASEGPRIDLSLTDTRQDTMKKYIETELERSFGGEESGLDKDKLLKIGEQIMNKFT